MSAGILHAGWLEKKAQSKKLGAKYQRRWFELTADTLAYAKNPAESKAAEIEVYSIQEMRGLRLFEEVKMEVSQWEASMRVPVNAGWKASRRGVALPSNAAPPACQHHADSLLH